MKHKQYKFTVPDVAKATGLPESKVRRDIRRGVFVPTDLAMAADYVAAMKLLRGLK